MPSREVVLVRIQSMNQIDISKSIDQIYVSKSMDQIGVSKLQVFFYPASMHEQDATQVQFLKQSLTGLNSKFFFSFRLVAIARWKSFGCITIYS